MIWLLALLVLLPTSAEAATWYVKSSGASTTGPADSCANTHVQAAINAASDGDTIQMGAGSCTWTDSPTNAYFLGSPATGGAYDSVKCVKIYGAGTIPLVGAATSSGTTITDNVPASTSSNMILLRESNAANCNVEIANITVVLVDGDGTSNGYAGKTSRIGWEPGTGGGAPAPGVAGAKVHLMHHMTFTDSRDVNDGPVKTIIQVSTSRGVMYRNSFTRAQLTNGHAIWRCALASGRASWESASTFGSADTGGDLNFYFEDNTLTNFSENSLDAACRAVWRGNTIENSGISGHGRDSQNPGSRLLEFYMNRFNCRGSGALTISNPVSLRGSVQIGWGNTFEEFGLNCTNAVLSADIAVSIFILTALDIGCFRQSGSPGVYPAPQQFSWGYTTGATTVTRDSDSESPYSQDREGSYYWNNYRPDGTTKITSDGVSADGGIYTYLKLPDTCGDGHAISTFIQENRDWYKQNDSFNGTTGIGVGARASRPATCTTGVAWWSTDQGGNWNTTNATANDGTLDKCTAANTWTNAFYTPYQYPHNLATVTGADLGGTVAPRGRPRWHGPHAKPDRRETP